LCTQVQVNGGPHRAKGDVRDEDYALTLRSWVVALA
jgi:hypothetical protein